jgi:hypothetical protein
MFLKDIYNALIIRKIPMMMIKSKDPKFKNYD